MKPKRWQVAVVALLLLAVAAAFFIGKPSRGIPLRLGIQTAPVLALPVVAYEKGFFAEEGLDVQMTEFTAGKFALQTMIAGSLDVATPAEVPPVLALLQGNSGFVILAQGVKRTTNEVRLVARRDGNLETPEAYFKAKKRKLATAFGTGAEFFTYSFLRFYNISNNEVELVNQKPQDMPASLASGSIDAIAIFDPFAYFAEQQSGDTITFKDDNLYSELYVFAARKDFMETNPGAAEKLVRALLKAEKFLHENPEETKWIVANFTRLDKHVLDAIWNNFDFGVAITPKLEEYMKAEEQWAKETGKVPSTASLPPFDEIIDSRPLRNASPEAVET
ncbi:NrtA/SsuA/CpmA family ABC transporter substrate-binding protein [Candidatus Micrarchaeota archaeon]|nr:NrtA/SsuA/CpmA family ABC transporter substrate-binding protein [Candidatus Micrarchaeota archaeon]